MDTTGTIREILPGEQLLNNEIDVTKYAKELKEMSKKARREYLRCCRAGLSEDTAIACARSVQRTRF